MARQFSSEHYAFASAPEVASGLNAALVQRPDAVLVQIDPQEPAAYDFCRALRLFSNAPLLIVGAGAGEAERVAALDYGADDYVSDTSSVRELVARIRALLRRAEYSAVPPAPHLVFGSVDIDQRGRTVRRDGRVVPLKPKEFDLLFFLASNPGRVYTRGQLIKRLWGYDVIHPTRTVDVHIHWLRDKLEERPRQPRHIQTIRGVGYKFVL
jgi:DNA-binding response OmpR family regulator